jgi:hypothetical protein
VSLTARYPNRTLPLALDAAPIVTVDLIDDATGARVGGIHPTADPASHPLAVICSVCYASARQPSTADAVQWLTTHRKDQHL